MIKITAKDVRELWLQTGASLNECSNALIINKGNFELSKKWLKENYLINDEEN